MKTGRQGVRAHVSMLAPFFALITGVFVLRWILAAAGSPPIVIKVVSVGVATAASILIAVILFYFRRTGGYSSVVITSLLLNSWSQLLVVLAILISVWSGSENIYTAPEYSMPVADPGHVRHIYSHLTFGIGIGTLVGAAGGSILHWLLGMLVPTLPRPEVPRNED